MNKPRRIEIYDTTLRDGAQGEGFSLSLQDKLAVVQKLDELGVDCIEGGFPLSNPKDEAFFREAQKLKLRHAKLAAFGMTRRRGIKVEDDAGMQALLTAETPVVTIVGKSSDYQAKTVLGVSLEENLAMISDSVRFLRQAGRTVVYDAEHFFDAWRANSDYALRTLMAAQEAGAAVITLCDTNGGSLPEQVAAATAAVRQKLSARVGIHTHNDGGLALANALAAINAGADHAQGTINGVGERCGNMDLLALAACLQLKYRYDCLAPGTLRKLTEVSRFVYETANMNIVPSQPYVGSSAFAHKAGMHAHAVGRDAGTYEHVAPETVGNTRRILISELSGVSNIATVVGGKFDIASDKALMRKVLHRIQDLENRGYQFEAANGSFELLLRKELGKLRDFFRLDHYRVVVLKTDDRVPVAEATVKLHVNGTVEHCVAEGDGPVAALDRALRKALLPHYPAISAVTLNDYKVRVINSRDGTAARVRVVVAFKRQTDGGAGEFFGTIGVSENIIDASWQALVDAYVYHLIQLAEAGAPAPASARA